MNRKIKLLILIILSLSVYFVYKETSNKTIKILSIGDNLSIGINSYGIKEVNYIYYYQEYLKNKNIDVQVINKYSNKDLTIKELLINTKTNSELKRDLSEAHQLYLNIGYNDLIYKISLKENINQNNLDIITHEIYKTYEELFNEITKYYKNKIVVIGYYASNKDDYYMNKGIKYINKYLENNEDIIYIDTYNLLNNREKYFSNPNSYYPNRLGYKAIGNKIIKNSLEKR